MKTKEFRRWTTECSALGRCHSRRRFLEWFIKPIASQLVENRTRISHELTNGFQGDDIPWIKRSTLICNRSNRIEHSPFTSSANPGPDYSTRAHTLTQPNKVHTYFPFTFASLANGCDGHGRRLIAFSVLWPLAKQFAQVVFRRVWPELLNTRMSNRFRNARRVVSVRVCVCVRVSVRVPAQEIDRFQGQRCPFCAASAPPSFHLTSASTQRSFSLFADSLTWFYLFRCECPTLQFPADHPPIPPQKPIQPFQHPSPKQKVRQPMHFLLFPFITFGKGSRSSSTPTKQLRSKNESKRNESLVGHFTRI